MKTTPRAIATLTAMMTAALVTASCQGIGLNEPERQVEGAYDTEYRYDMQSLTGAVSGSVAAWGAPDTVIRDKILAKFRSKFGATIADTIESYYGQQIARDIRAFFEEFAPAWLLDLPPKLALIDSQLKMIDIQTSILLAPQAEGGFKATQIWNGITVFKDPACKTSGGLLCDQVSVGIQDLLGAEYPLEILSSDFTGSETSQNVLEMKSHAIKFNYGRLGLYLLTNLVFPDEPGNKLQIRDVILAGINCRGVAGRLAGDDDTLGWTIAGVKVGLSINELIGSCQDGAFAMVNSFVDQFNLPLTIDLRGAMQLVDTNFDGVIDQLAIPKLQGDAQVKLLNGSSKGGAIDGLMTGFRVGNNPNTTTNNATVNNTTSAATTGN